MPLQRLVHILLLAFRLRGLLRLGLPAVGLAAVGRLLVAALVGAGLRLYA